MDRVAQVLAYQGDSHHLDREQPKDVLGLRESTALQPQALSGATATALE